MKPGMVLVEGEAEDKLTNPQVSVSDAELNWVSVKALYPFPKGL